MNKILIYNIAKAFKLEPALNGGFKVSFGSLSHISVSFICSASPKSTHKTAPLRSQNFVTKVFFDERGKNAVNPNGFTSILTKSQQEILVPKSDSSLNALAIVVKVF